MLYKTDTSKPYHTLSPHAATGVSPLLSLSSLDLPSLSVRNLPPHPPPRDQICRLRRFAAAVARSRGSSPSRRSLVTLIRRSQKRRDQICRCLLERRQWELSQSAGASPGRSFRGLVRSSRGTSALMVQLTGTVSPCSPPPPSTLAVHPAGARSSLSGHTSTGTTGSSGTTRWVAAATAAVLNYNQTEKWIDSSLALAPNLCIY
jgi:hypothetical protein